MEPVGPVANGSDVDAQKVIGRRRGDAVRMPALTVWTMFEGCPSFSASIYVLQEYVGLGDEGWGNDRRPHVRTSSTGDRRNYIHKHEKKQGQSGTGRPMIDAVGCGVTPISATTLIDLIEP